MDSFQEKYPKTHNFLNENAALRNAIKLISQGLTKQKLIGTSLKATLEAIKKEAFSTKKYADLSAEARKIRDATRGAQTARLYRTTETAIKNADVPGAFKKVAGAATATGKTIAKHPKKTAAGGAGGYLYFTGAGKVAPGTEAAKQTSNAISNMSKTGKIVTGTALAIALGGFAYKVYKDHISQIGKQCGKLKGEDYDKCADMVRKKGLTQTISKLNQLKTQCDKSKDPEKCKRKLDERIRKYQTRLSNI